MSRRGGRGTDGAYGDGTWLPGGYAAGSAEDDDGAAAGHEPDARHRPRGSTRTSPDGDSPTGPPWEEASPPWEEPGWDDSIPRPGLDPADLAGKHPSEPLPSLPSLPSEPLQEGDWPDTPLAFGYPSEADQEPGYPGTGYPAEAGHEPGYPHHATDADGAYAGGSDDDTGYGYAGYADAGYDHGGYPEADYHAGYDTGTGFPAAGGEFPEPGGFADTDAGYAHPAYGDAGLTADAGRYPEHGDYPAEDDHYLQYLEYREPTAGPGGRGDDHGYPGPGGWYGDVDEQRSWAEGDDGAFLPGMGPGTRGRAGRPDDDLAPGPRYAGPGQRGSGGPRPGKAGPGKAGGGKAQGGKRKRGLRRVAPWLALSVVLALLIGAGAGYLYVYRTYLHPSDFSGEGTGSVVVRVVQGDTASVVGQRLETAGVVASARAFSNAAKASGQGTALEPGYYRVHRHMNAALAFALLLRPSSRVQTKITIPEGQRLSQIIATLGRETGDPQGYRQASKDVKALNLPPFAHGSPEGYLFPATYDVQPNTPPVKVLQRMVTRFGQEAASISLPSAAAHAELTQAQVIVVASLIQAEGGRPSDFPKIARVIYNRLNSSPQIPLQLDSTVMYALHKYGIIATSQQTKVSSPYNTYQHTGLPPGPIDSPGDAAIKAALHPAHGTWMYFATVNPKTGLTKFTSSFAQFQQFRAELAANIAKGK
jgi:UPF0755 protein